MKKFKRLQAFLLSVILVFSLVFSACGGATSDSSVESVNSSVESSEESSEVESSEEIVTLGTFYTLEEAYKLGFISKEDLQTIADIRNGIQSSPNEKLSDELAAEIKEARAKELREQLGTSYPDIEAKDIDLTWFYGFYNNYPVLKIFSRLEFSFGVDYPTTLDIDGVIFYFNHPRIIKTLVVYVRNS
jgi:hypothetical protein